MGNTVFITEPVIFESDADKTHTPQRIKIPGKQGRIRSIVTWIPIGQTTMVVDVAYADNADTDLTDFDDLDPTAVRAFITGIAYLGVDNPAGPKIVPMVQDDETLFTENAIFDADDQDEHVVAIRVTGSSAAYQVQVQFKIDIYR